MGVKERKEREKELRKKSILTASEKLFMENGFRSTSIEQIASEIEMSRGAIYLYFKNKEEIYLNIIRKALDTLYDILSGSYTESDDPLEKMRKIGSAYLRFYRENRNCFMLTNFVFDSDSKEIVQMCIAYPETAEEIYKTDKKTWDLVSSVYADGIRQGIFRPDIDPTEITLMLWSATNGIIRFIDHVEMARLNRPADFRGACPAEFYDSSYAGLSLEDMVDKHWEITLNYVLTDKNIRR